MLSLAHGKIKRSSIYPRCLLRWLFVFKSFIIVWLIANSLIGPVSAESISSHETPLTLEVALRMAEERSASLQGQDAEIRALREQEISARQLPDPALRLSIDNLPVEGAMRYSLTDDFMTMRSVGLMQTFVSADKRIARSTRFDREAEVVASMRSMTLTKLRMQTARAWFNRYFRQQMLQLMLDQREEAILTVKGAEAAYRSGNEKQADIFSARSSVASIDNRLYEIRADLSNAETELSRWIGHVVSQPSGPLPPINQSRHAAHQLIHQLDQHPDIALMRAKEQVAQSEVEIARQEKKSDWTWSLMYSKRGNQFGDMLSFGVSIPIQWDQKNRQDREIAAKLNKVEQARAEREEMQREHLSEVQQMLTSWRAALNRLQDYEKSLIPLATQRTQALEISFKAGKSPLTAVLESRRMEIDTRMERLRIEKEVAELWTELEFLIPEQLVYQSIPDTSSTTSVQGDLQ